MPSPAGKAVGQVQAAKQAARERVWEHLERSGAAPPPGAYGRIPIFERADAAADRLTRLPEWHAARIVTANPDWAQMPVRTRALAAGKIVYMAVPRLAGEYPSGTRFSSETADVLVARLGSRRSRPAGPGRAGLEGALGLLLGSGIDCDLRVPLDKPAPQPGPAGGGRSWELPGVGCVLRDGGEFVHANLRCLGV